MGLAGILLILALVFFVIGHWLIALVCLVIGLALLLPGGGYSRRGWY